MQAEFKEYLFLCVTNQKLLEISETSLVGQPVRIRMPLPWPRTSTEGIHKIFENSCRFVSPT